MTEQMDTERSEPLRGGPNPYDTSDFDECPCSTCKHHREKRGTQ